MTLQEWLIAESTKPYMLSIKEKVQHARRVETVYPSADLVFRAYEVGSPRVVIVGQDPYHGPNQANGYAFAVNDGVTTPPSLRNIFKEIELEVGAYPASPTLEGWVAQGVVLLNTSLTVKADTPGSHSAFGWQTLTSNTISFLSETPGLVFMLWGKYAQGLTDSIRDPEEHLVLKSAHPSPYSASGFFGCNHFRLANQYLISRKKGSIDWTL